MCRITAVNRIKTSHKIPKINPCFGSYKDPNQLEMITDTIETRFITPAHLWE